MDGAAMRAIPTAPNFSTPLAAKLTGVSQGTLENWARRGFLKPSGGGGKRRDPRLYAFRDLIAIRVADGLRQRGVDVRHLRRVVHYLRSRHGLELSATDVLAGSV
ncbi:MAG: MerR family transcriptional regulator, partial [Polyangiaceae bacterium]|nr:MerR family transcriptional regulator [Polyangiaceae bacterium]